MKWLNIMNLLIHLLIIIKYWRKIEFLHRQWWKWSTRLWQNVVKKEKYNRWLAIFHKCNIQNRTGQTLPLLKYVMLTQFSSLNIIDQLIYIRWTDKFLDFSSKLICQNFLPSLGLLVVAQIIVWIIKVWMTAIWKIWMMLQTQLRF